MVIMNLSTDSSSKHYVYFILITILIFLAMGEWVVRYFIIPIPNTTPYIVHLVYTKNNRNIAIGDSHIYRGFIANSYFLNLGRGGMTIPMMKIIIEQYFKYRKPGKVIIEASPQLLCRSHIHKGSEGYEEYFNQNYSFLPFKIYLFEPGIGSWIKKVRSIDSFSKLIEERKKAEKAFTLKSNWQNMPEKKRLKMTIQRIKKQRPCIKKAKKFVDTYEKMVDFLLGESAKVCLLRTPVDPDYLRLTKNDPSFSNAIEIFKNIAEEKGIHFVDFQEMNYEFTLDKFINQDHITPKASRKFSMLAKELCFDR